MILFAITQVKSKTKVFGEIKSAHSPSRRISLHAVEFHRRRQIKLKTTGFCRNLSFSWWTLGDSNPRPPARQAGALPAELNVRINLQGLLYTKHLKMSSIIFIMCLHSVSYYSTLVHIAFRYNNLQFVRLIYMLIYVNIMYI